MAIRSLFLALIIVAIGACSAWGQNAVQNGTFDASGANWSFVSPATGTEAYLFESTYGGISTTNHVAEVDDGANLQQTITVTPGVSYTLSFLYSRRNVAPNPCNTTVRVYEGAAGGGGTSLVNAPFTASNSSWNWQCYSSTFTSTSSTVTLEFTDNNANFTTLGMIVDNISVSPTTEQTVTATPQASCEGGTVTLAAPSSSDPNSTYSNYSWTGPGGFTSSSASPVLSGITAAQAGTYTATMQLNNGCMQVSGSVTVSVSPAFRDTTLASICDGSSYAFQGSSYNQTGMYTTNYPTSPAGCDSSYTLNLTVNPVYDNTVVAVICAGQSYLFNGTTYTTSGTYTTMFTSVSGCDSQVTVQLSVTPPLSGAESVDICQGQSYNFNGTPLNVSGVYVDTFSGTGGCDSVVVLSLTVHPVYSGDAPDDTICVGMDAMLSVDISQPSGVSFTVAWTSVPGSLIDDPASATTVAHPAVADTRYIATITPNGIAACAVNDTVDVKVLQGFNITNGDTVVCKGAVININGAGDPLYQYQWVPDLGVSNDQALNTQITPVVTLTYTLTASFPGCPDSAQSLTIGVEPTPQLSIGNDTVLCYGTLYRLPATVLPDDYPLYTYSWTPGGMLLDDQVLNPLFTATDTATLTLVVSTPSGCQSRDSLTLFVEPQHFFSVSNDTAICPGDTALLLATAGSPVDVVWAPAYSLSDSLGMSLLATPDFSTTYTVYATNAGGCRDTATVDVAVYPGAVFLLPDSVTIYPGDAYEIQPGGNCLYASWFPPLGLSSDQVINPIAQPPVDTRYYVIARTEAGCQVSDSIDVNVSHDSQIDMPNAFVPGNGPNNVLKPVHLGIATLVSFRIFDRWGVEVFSSTSIETGWDGTYKGVPQPMGVYVYLVEAKTYQGRPFRKQGNVTLIR